MAAQLPESDQTKQFNDFLETYNKLIAIYFLDFVKDFITREVKPEEIISLAAKAGFWPTRIEKS
uniref:Uncharacterized protein n=2 Tax=Canis lupus familiaris TaxID=9615 RepID=A0A8C0M6I6_CANLF